MQPVNTKIQANSKGSKRINRTRLLRFIGTLSCKGGSQFILILNKTMQ